MTDAVDAVFIRAKRLAARLESTGNYSAFRPDYSNNASVETPIAGVQAVRMRVRHNPGSARFATVAIPGAEYFTITCEWGVVQAGDVLIRTPASDSSFPITVVSAAESPQNDSVGVRTDLMGKFMNSRKETAVFDNVRFGYVRSGGDDQKLDGEMPGANWFQSGQILVWRRANLETGMRFYDYQNKQTLLITGFQFLGNAILVHYGENYA